MINNLFKISSYGDRNISNHTNRTEPYVENFRLVIYCYGCDTKMQSEQFENITTSSIKEINISGDVFGVQNLNYMIHSFLDFFKHFGRKNLRFCHFRSNNTN